MPESPSVEIYSIGTELLMGQIQDTNAFWLAQQVARLGGVVRRMSILDDDIADVVQVLGDAVSRRTTFIITTGGLGPTPDDLTVDAVARLANLPVVVSEKLVERFMETRGIPDRRDVKPGLIRMARAPEGATIHPNPAGVAPCIEIALDGTTLFCLPGPPREVQALFAQSIEGALSDRSVEARAERRVAVNVPESELGPILHAVMARHPGTYLKAYVALRLRSDDGQRLPVDIVARDADVADAERLLSAALTTFTALISAKGQAVHPLPPA